MVLSEALILGGSGPLQVVDDLVSIVLISSLGVLRAQSDSFGDELANLRLSTLKSHMNFSFIPPQQHPEPLTNQLYPCW